MHLPRATGEAGERDDSGRGRTAGRKSRGRGSGAGFGRSSAAGLLVRRGLRSLGPVDRPLLVADRPDGTGDARFDALLAAIVEHLCTKASLAVPAWANEPSRFLDTWWFVSGLRSLHADALVHSPISFARRGVFIAGDALTYA